jgi:hypothetical protein
LIEVSDREISSSESAKIFWDEVPYAQGYLVEFSQNLEKKNWLQTLTI